MNASCARVAQRILFFIVMFPLYAIEERWNWNAINWKRTITFPANFLWGTADSAFQVEGIISADGSMIQNSWTVWEKQLVHRDGRYEPRFHPDKRAGIACDRWNLYKQDVQLMKEIGIQAHRFSIEWTKIEPQRGVFDEAAMQHYIDYIQELIDNDIEPVPTFFHHLWPLWFEYPEEVKRGTRGMAFEDARNIADFVAFAAYVFATIYKRVRNSHKIRYWLTFNEPLGEALAAYVYPLYPPGKRYRIRQCGIVAKNMLDAHIAIYDACKKINPNAQIGFAHLMHPLHPYHPWNPLDWIPAKIFNYLMNLAAIRYFKTGYFHWMWLYRGYNPDAPKKLDFIGVNYYTHGIIKMFKEVVRPDEILADGPDGKHGKPFYPEGLYYSLKQVAQLGIPILVTENGCATDDPALREEYIKKHLYVIDRCRREGMDIRGYFFWTLMDCFGFNSGQHRKHGIYEVNFETQERTLRPSSQYLLDVIQRHNMLYKK